MAAPVVIPGQFGPVAGTVAASSFMVYGGPASAFIQPVAPEPAQTQIIAPPVVAAAGPAAAARVWAGQIGRAHV